MEPLPAHLVPLGELGTGRVVTAPGSQKKNQNTSLPGASVLSTARRTLCDERLEVGPGGC